MKESQKTLVRQRFKELYNQVEKLTFSEESLIELGSIKLEAERISNSIKAKEYRGFCINEIAQINTDEFHDMFNTPSSETFQRARNEFILILQDCYYGSLNAGHIED